MTYNQALGLAIRTQRAIEAVTAFELSAYLGLGVSGFSRIENGVVPLTVDRLRIIAIFFDIAPSVLLERAESFLSESQVKSPRV